MPPRLPPTLTLYIPPFLCARACDHILRGYRRGRRCRAQADQSWNPAEDLQAIFRSYRYGQTKPVFVYRLVASGAMEDKIFRRQLNKRALALGVNDDDQQVDCRRRGPPKPPPSLLFLSPFQSK